MGLWVLGILIAVVVACALASVTRRRRSVRRGVLEPGQEFSAFQPGVWPVVVSRRVSRLQLQFTGSGGGGGGGGGKATGTRPGGGGGGGGGASTVVLSVTLLDRRMQYAVRTTIGAPGGGGSSAVESDGTAGFAAEDTLFEVLLLPPGTTTFDDGKVVYQTIIHGAEGGQGGTRGKTHNGEGGAGGQPGALDTPIHDRDTVAVVVQAIDRGATGRSGVSAADGSPPVSGGNGGFSSTGGTSLLVSL